MINLLSRLFDRVFIISFEVAIVIVAILLLDSLAGFLVLIAMKIGGQH